MKEYKVANIGGGNLTNQFVKEEKINELAKDGWVLVNVQQPPAVQNNRFIAGVFVRDAAPVAAPPKPAKETPKEVVKEPAKVS